MTTDLGVDAHACAPASPLKRRLKMIRISFTRLWQTRLFRFALLFVAAAALCAALVGVRATRAASSTSGTLTIANTQANPLHFTGGPFYAGNQTGFNSALGGL